jgi:hypothetical protein
MELDHFGDFDLTKIILIYRKRSLPTGDAALKGTYFEQYKSSLGGDGARKRSL